LNIAAGERYAAPVGPNTEGDAKLLAAARRGEVEELRALAAAGANLEARDDDDHMTPLMNAVKQGHERVVDALIELGADVDAAPARGLVYEGYRALHLACVHRHGDVAERLLAAGADVNAGGPRGETPLMIAAKKNDARVAQMLLRAGAQPGAERDDGYTALGLAGGNSTARIILDALADLKTYRVRVEGLARVWSGEHANALDAAWAAALQAYTKGAPPESFNIVVEGAGEFVATTRVQSRTMRGEGDEVVVYAYAVRPRTPD
jgi:hypothetical protein